MSKIAMGGAFAALFLSAGCATDPYLQDSATLGASGQFGAPAIHMDDGKRKEIMVGSRISRDSRENSGEVDQPARLRGKPHGEAQRLPARRRRLKTRADRPAHRTHHSPNPRRKR